MKIFEKNRLPDYKSPGVLNKEEIMEVTSAPMDPRFKIFFVNKDFNLVQLDHKVTSFPLEFSLKPLLVRLTLLNSSADLD